MVRHNARIVHDPDAQRKEGLLSLLFRLGKSSGISLFFERVNTRAGQVIIFSGVTGQIHSGAQVRVMRSHRQARKDGFSRGRMYRSDMRSIGDRGHLGVLIPYDMRNNIMQNAKVAGW
jgi:hypothetical protein